MNTFTAIYLFLKRVSPIFQKRHNYVDVNIQSQSFDMKHALKMNQSEAFTVVVKEPDACKKPHIEIYYLKWLQISKLCFTNVALY